MINKIIFLFFFSLLFTSCSEKNKSIKIFDVHLHGAKDPTTQMKALENASVYKAAISSSWELQNSYRRKTKINLLYGLMFPCPNGIVPYSKQSCYANGKEWPDINWVEQQIKEEKIDFFGEVLSQYYGISSSDTSLYPYYSLAEKYNLPVGIHTGSAGPDHGSPYFKEAMGNPELLNELLAKFPKLKVWIMHAGGPFLKETISMMKTYPLLYADISAINNPDIVPSPQFKIMMKALMEAGLEDRLLFGSDNGDIQIMIASVNSLDFFSQEQKEKIFYRNAETFFKK